MEDEETNRRVAIITQDENRDYHVRLSSALPEDTSLDDFHAGENEIYLQFQHQQWMAGYVKQADGVWRLSWVMGDLNYTVAWYGVQWDEQRLIGAVSGSDLFTADFSVLPRAEEALKKTLDAAGWAAVSNPNPKDRLHLRVKPDKNADSLGKFYNGTPLAHPGNQGRLVPRGHRKGWLGGLDDEAIPGLFTNRQRRDTRLP